MIATHTTLDIEDYIYGLGQNARLAAKKLANASTAQKNQTLTIADQVGEFGIGPRSVSPWGNARSWPRGPGTIDQFQMVDRGPRPDSTLNQFSPLPL